MTAEEWDYSVFPSGFFQDARASMSRTTYFGTRLAVMKARDGELTNHPRIASLPMQWAPLGALP